MLYEQVLYTLEKKRGEIVTGGEIARAAGVSRTAVWKTVLALKEDGHEIESIPNSGYRLRQESDGLSLQAIRDYLTTEKLGRSIELLKTVDSTNSYLKAGDTAVVRDGHTVLANGQTGGRGRLGRTFYSPTGSGVYLSCLLKPPIPISETPFLTICAAVAVYRAIRDTCGIKTDIKWVNDLYAGGKKLCGILTEAGVNAEMRCVDYAVVGIGVNTCGVAPEVSEIATSIFTETGVRGVRNRLIAEILNHFEQVYFDYIQRGKKQEILNAYTERLFIIGKPVEVVEYGGSYKAVALGVDAAGRLLVKRQNGETVGVDAGEVRIEIPSGKGRGSEER